MLIVEDGTGVTDANAFCSVADVEAYLSLRGLTRFSLLANTAAKEAAIVNASEWLSNAYTWHGVRILDTQGLAWPRYGRSRRLPVGVPSRIVQATARVAEIIASGTNLFKTVKSADLVRRVQAGSVSVEFADQALEAAENGGTSLPFLDDMLAGLYDVAPDGTSSNGVSTLWVSRQ